VIGVAGKVPLETLGALNEYFDVLLSINHEPMDLSLALLQTRANLVRTGREIGKLLGLHK
jgi:glycerate 2-kinase